MMTDLQKARMLIQDTDPTNQIFTDEEINEVLTRKRQRKVLRAQRASVDGTVYVLPLELSRDGVDGTIYNDDGEELTGTIDYEKSEVTFDENPGTDVYVDAEYILFRGVQGTLLEIIATDIRKWNTYSAGGLSETFSKQELLNYARSMFPVTGAW